MRTKNLILILGLLILAACTRSQGDHSTVSMTLPDFRSMSNADSKTDVSAQSSNGLHIILNVTGDGASVYCSYDSNHGTSVGPCQFNYPSLSVDVPMGQQRLFQLMVAVDGASSTTFSYGETKADLTGSSASLNMTVSPLTGNGKVGHVSGRFVGGTVALPDLPTGVVQILYKPASGGPPMVLMAREMFAGWAQLIAFGAIPLTYQINGKPLFANAMALEDFEALTSQAAPYGDDVAVYSENATFDDVVGWFGTGTDSANQSVMNGTCTGNEFSTCLNNSATTRSNFVGPFKAGFSGFYGVSGSVLTLNFLPSTETSISDVKFIRVAGVTDPNMFMKYYIDDGMWDCATLAADYPSNIQSGIIASGAVTVSLTSDLAANDVVFACPMKGSSFLRSAVAYPEFYNSYGHGGYQGPYVHLALVGASSSSGVDIYSMNLGSCYEVDAGLYQGQGNVLTASATLTISSIASSQGSFWTDAACTTSAATPYLVINSGSSSTTSTGLYFKPTVTGSGSITFSVSDPSTMANPQMIQIQ